MPMRDCSRSTICDKTRRPLTSHAPPLQVGTDLGPRLAAFQTGPKGVIKDWQRYKQLEAEKRAAQSLEKMQLAKKLTMTCRSVPVGN